MAMMTGRKRAVGEAPWSRAIEERASARGMKNARGTKSAFGLASGRDHKSVGFKCRLESVRMPLRRSRLLGAPGRAGAAHVMQFRPVGIESPGEELTAEIADLGEGIAASVAAFRRGGER